MSKIISWLFLSNIYSQTQIVCIHTSLQQSRCVRSLTTKTYENENARQLDVAAYYYYYYYYYRKSLNHKS